MRKDTANFIASAEYDLNTAEHMLKTGRYIYVIFASIVTRYSEDFKKLIEAYPENIAESYLSQTKEIIEWLKQNEKLGR